MKRSISLLLAALLLTSLFSGCVGIALPPLNQDLGNLTAEPARTEASTPKTEPPETEAPSSKPDDPQPAIFENPCGRYTLKAMNGMSLREYFEEQFAEYLGPESDLDLETLLSMSGISLDSIEEMMTITLNQDGTAIVTYLEGEGSEAAEGTWEQNGNKIIITVEDDPQEFIYENGQLLFGMDGEEMVFAR